MSAAHIIYPLFLTLMPRRTEGTQPDSLYPTLEALADDEISHFVDKLGAYLRNGLSRRLLVLPVLGTSCPAAYPQCDGA